jgi:hypothetical protein
MATSLIGLKKRPDILGGLLRAGNQEQVTIVDNVQLAVPDEAGHDPGIRQWNDRSSSPRHRETVSRFPVLDGNKTGTEL